MPSFCAPQVPLPVLQLLVTQSALVVHLLLHEVLLAQIREPLHGCAAPATQFPLPSQLLTVMVEIRQDESQTVPWSLVRQPPLPSQVPSVPQAVPETAQALCALWPAVTGRHMPSLCPFRVAEQA